MSGSLPDGFSDRREILFNDKEQGSHRPHPPTPTPPFCPHYTRSNSHSTAFLFQQVLVHSSQLLFQLSILSTIEVMISDEIKALCRNRFPRCYDDMMRITKREWCFFSSCNLTHLTKESQRVESGMGWVNHSNLHRAICKNSYGYKMRLKFTGHLTKEFYSMVKF